MQPVAVLFRDAEHEGDDRRRQGERIVLDHVEAALHRHPVEQIVDDLVDQGFQFPDLARREGGGEQPAHPCVDRRVVEDQAGCVVGIKRPVAEFRLEIHLLVGTHRRVLEGQHHVLVAGQQPGAVRVAMDRIVFPQSPVHRERVVQKILADGVEIEGQRGIEVGHEGRHPPKIAGASEIPVKQCCGQWPPARTGHARTGHARTGHARTGHARTGHARTGHARTGHARTGHARTGHARTGHARTGHARAPKCASPQCRRAGQPPVTLIWRETAGAVRRRSITKSWPFGFRVIASRIASSSRPSSSLARKGARRSAASSWPRHI